MKRKINWVCPNCDNFEGNFTDSLSPDDCLECSGCGMLVAAGCITEIEIVEFE